jgi:hypothetical protein
MKGSIFAHGQGCAQEAHVRDFSPWSRRQHTSHTPSRPRIAVQVAACLPVQGILVTSASCSSGPRIGPRYDSAIAVVSIRSSYGAPWSS